MPNIDVHNVKGEVVGKLELSENIFGIEVNESTLHLVVKNQLANKRQGTQSTKTKSEVSGGGKKPWKQKGTGRARQGSTRSAQWTGGGIVLGPKPRSYRYTLPKKVRRIALKSAFASKVNEKEMLVLDELKLDEFKTKRMVEIFNNLKVDGTALLVIEGCDKKVVNSARNIPGVTVASVNTINVYDILRHRNLIMTKDAVSKVEEVYA
ncbi:MAG: 50S ribosomal protein L4 [Clostridiales bacterium]|nr:50S ribosomal protein L4 [Clostridiales bacterium]